MDVELLETMGSPRRTKPGTALAAAEANGGRRPSPPPGTSGEMVLQGIWKSFGGAAGAGRARALQDIHLTIRPGEFVVLVGPSGCGKSTLLNIAAGMIRPDAGGVLLDGKPVSGPGPERAMVFQDHGLFPWLTASGNIEFGLKMMGVPRQERQKRVREGLEMVHLTHAADKLVHELSGGMRQRVSIARALVMDPKVLLMDEPFAALDAQTRTLLHEQLQEIWLRTNKTILFVTHSVGEAVRLADRIIVLHAHPGRIRREIAVELGHPRSFDSHDISSLVRTVRKEIEDEVNRVNANSGTRYGGLKRLTIWLLLLATWEAAYRVVGWRAYVFPAPSHVLDGTLEMLRVNTAFGGPIDSPRWPLPPKPMTDAAKAGQAAFRAGAASADNPYAAGRAGDSAASASVAQWKRGFEVAVDLGRKFRALRAPADWMGVQTGGLFRLPETAGPNLLTGAAAVGYADAWTKSITDNPYLAAVTAEEKQRSEAESDWRRGFETASQHWYNSPLVEAVIVSLVRLAIGFLLSIAIGLVVGVLAWRFEEVDKFIGPLLLGVQTLPSVCWVPLAVLVFGINEKAVMFVLAMGSFSAVAIALRDGLRAIPPLYQQAGRMMGARRLSLYWYVLLPASLPALATSLRQGFSFAWRSLMGAELILVVHFGGIGHLLAVGRDLNAVNQVIAVLLVMILIGILADKWVFAKLQQRISRRFGLAPSGG